MKDFWKNKRVLWTVYALAAIIVSAQALHLGERAGGYTFYENYVIFKNAFPHLLHGLNPYADFPAEQWDLYKYSPAFALFMAPFAALPDWAGLPLWNLLNALVLLAAILRLPLLSEGQRVFIAWFVLLELITSMQNSQSNGLTAGLMLWTFIAFERGKMWQAAGFVAGAAFIKIFGFASAVLALLYAKWRAFPVFSQSNGGAFGESRPRGAFWKFVGWLMVWVLSLALIPLLLMLPSHLWQVYEWWWELLRDDHAASVGLSVQGWLQTWFGWMPSKMGVTLAGMAILTASIFAVSRVPSAANRVLACASLLLWVVIFNHKAESPTFVIAMCGVALWWCVAGKKAWEHILLWVVFVLVSLSPTDVFPPNIRREIIQPFVLKAVPCIVVWCLVTWRMLAAIPRKKGFEPARWQGRDTFD
ncbi:MAG: DUF2029 domain-containing protein [Saprospiraceae bacterium]|nr:DUF2029 domain-containing protein [Saprospiraceae bacterium]